MESMENYAEVKSNDNQKIYCANCIHCVVVKVPLDDNKGRYVLRVKCKQQKWRKKLGEEKLYKYFTVIRRTMDDCPDYESMGDAKEFLRELRKNLPDSDEVYQLAV